MSWPIVGFIALAFVAGVAIGVAITLRRRGRMRRVAEGAAELARGNLGHRVLLAGSDDAARAAEALNAFADAMQTERERSNARDSAQRQLLANISHDLRTPIASIGGYVDALQRGLGDDPERYLAIVAQKTGELAELTDDLFYEARIDAGDLELKRGCVDLAEAVRRALLGFEPQLSGRAVRVRVDIPDKPCPVDADASAVARILGNLLSNALRHAETMTSLDVVLAEKSGACTVRIANDGAHVPADAERLFERGVASSGGSGLGLWIARDLAQRMGGNVCVESAGDDTMSFALTLSAAAGTE